MTFSLARLEAIPASARNFCRRTSMAETRDVRTSPAPAVHSAARIRHGATRSSFAFGLAQTGDAITHLPLSALFEEFNAFKTLQDVSLRAQSADAPETRML